MDVETERKAPAPGLKEKDEEEKSGIGTEEVEERPLEGGSVLRPRQQKSGASGSPTELARGRVPHRAHRPGKVTRESRTQDSQKCKGTVLTSVPRKGGGEGKEGARVSGTPVLKL